jgi:hypothetical protein
MAVSTAPADVLARSARAYTTRELATGYGFTDLEWPL